MDGVLRLVEARGPSSAAAQRNIQVKLKERQTPRYGIVTAKDRINTLIDVFLVEMEASDKADRTKDKYSYCVKKYIKPALGSVRISEVTSGVVDHFIRTLVSDVGSSTARSCGAVLSWMFKVALRHDAVTVNPVVGVSIPKNSTAKPKALNMEQYRDLRAKLIAWEQAPTLGRPRTQELHEIADFLVGTGLRPGELLALHWKEIDLESEPPTASINATIIRTTRGGVRIQDHPKSRHGVRRLTLPAFLVVELRKRRQHQETASSPNPTNLVFPSSTGTICDANNVGKVWRKAADSIGYNWVTFRTLRKSNATVVARTMGAEAAAYQLGHSKIAMTQEHYIEEYKEALDTRAVLDGFVTLPDGDAVTPPSPDKAEAPEEEDDC
ncbi:site-specific integrase [Arthrobacter sp. AETb3-4]|uniref:Site-specific integrase n=2 Tax=Arthrobacter wenxiniae TaxID=2713570 RepID=A0A7Y7LZL8_9MICC|nr:site-specific integrase [Arthrobacter wenxiniae]